MSENRRPSPPIRFQDAIETVESLPAEDQEELIDLIQRRLAERRRAEIARHAEETLQAVREGRAQYGNFEDLRQDLMGNELLGPRES